MYVGDYAFLSDLSASFTIENSGMKRLDLPPNAVKERKRFYDHVLIAVLSTL